MRMKLEAYVRLVDWLRKNADRLKKEKPSWEEASRQAEAALGKKISKNTLQAGAKAAGVSWEHRDPNPGWATASKLVPELLERVKVLEGQVQQLQGRVNSLEQVVLESGSQLIGSRP